MEGLILLAICVPFIFFAALISEGTIATDTQAMLDAHGWKEL